MFDEFIRRRRTIISRLAEIELGRSSWTMPFPTLSFACMPKKFEDLSNLSEKGVEYKHGPSKELRIALQQPNCLLPTQLTSIRLLHDKFVTKEDLFECKTLTWASCRGFGKMTMWIATKHHQV
jgi:hypothetical protein